MRTRRVLFSIFPLLILPVMFLIGSGVALQDEYVGDDGDFSIDLWPGGIVWYQFDTSVPTLTLSIAQQQIVRDQMDRWERALTLTDSLHLDQTRQYIDFKECDANNPCAIRNHVSIRKNDVGEDNNFCGWYDANHHAHVGMQPVPGGVTTMNLQDFSRNTVLHELGHCLGLWHDHNRDDALRWLIMEVLPNFPDRIMPILGNYDYDSVMHYASYDSAGPDDCADGNIRFRDKLGNTFCRWFSDHDNTSQGVSDLDISRILQYYAREHRPNWGFFTSLSTGYNDSNPDALPNPYLAEDVEAVGTPAISYQGPGDYDIFVLGSDHQLYWKRFQDDEADDWFPMGCCIGSEPAAYSRNNGEIDLLAVEYITGRLFYNHFEAGAWAGWQLVLDGYPPGQIKLGTTTKYIGPAVTARNVDLLDVFVVSTDGLLSLTTLENGNWSMWHTVGEGYDVTARPAAIAMPPDQIQLAINESVDKLYEPLVTFTPADPLFVLGELKGYTADSTPPALARRREDPFNPYRVLIINRDGHISHRFTMGRWRDIGGVPLEGTGPSAVTMGPYSALIVMNGEDAWSCQTNCIVPPDPGDPNPGPGPGEIQPGGLWLRVFDGQAEEIDYTFLPVVQNR